MTQARRHRVQGYFEDPTSGRVLRAVREAGTVSRTELARICDLSKPTISEIVARFLADGILHRAGVSSSTGRGGRRRELLTFNPGAGSVIAVDIRMTQCVVAVTDLEAAVLQRHAFSYPRGCSPEVVLGELYQRIGRLFSDTSGLEASCVGVGIGLPGLIDPVRRVVRVADTLAGWDGVDLGAAFAARLDYPLFIENDVKTRAVAEHLFGSGKDSPNQVYLWIGDGIGAGIIIDGRLYHGITQSAGEVGYNQLCANGVGRELVPLLFEGQRDFGEILSNAVILRRYAMQTRSREPLSIEVLARKAAEGDEIAAKILDEVVVLASIVCINILNTLNPEILVLGGLLFDAAPPLVDRIRSRVHEDILSAPVEAVQIRPAALGEDGVIRGAAGVVLHDLFRLSTDGPFEPGMGGRRRAA